MLHFINDDEEWTRAFQEAVTFASGYAMRSMFVSALMFNSLVSPADISSQLRVSFCDDLEHAIVHKEHSRLENAQPAAEFSNFFGRAPEEIADKTGFSIGLKTFNKMEKKHSNADPVEGLILTRVVKDIFHLMDMAKPYKKHSIYENFCRKFSESLITLDEADLANVKAALGDDAFSVKLKYNRPWLWKRIKSVLKTVRLGHASDPPGVQLYYKTGHKDDLGLTLYRCVRGTNFLEEGVHQNLMRKFGSFNAGPELGDAMLAEYRLRHNIDVGYANRMGKVYKGHYDPWLLQQTQQLYDELGIVFNYHDEHRLALKFVGSKEVYGTCLLPAAEMSRFGVMPADEQFMEEHDDDPTIPKLIETVYTSIDSTFKPENARYI
ncbi:hypothetical protein MBANPS3_012247 [Mucor bainieri]